MNNGDFRPVVALHALPAGTVAQMAYTPYLPPTKENVPWHAKRWDVPRVTLTLLSSSSLDEGGYCPPSDVHVHLRAEQLQEYIAFLSGVERQMRGV